MTYQAAVLADSPLIYWPLNEPSGTVAADLSTNNLPGTYAGSGVTYGVAGPLFDGTKCVTFDGAAGFVRRASAINLAPYASVSLELWANFPSFNENDKMLAEFSPNWGANAGAFVVDPNESVHHAFSVGDSGVAAAQNENDFPRPSTGVWHYFAFTFNTGAGGAGLCTTRMDGVAQTMTNRQSNGVPTFGSYGLNFASRNGSSLFYNVSIAQIALYPYALSDARADAHYAARLDQPVTLVAAHLGTGRVA